MARRQFHAARSIRGAHGARSMRGYAAQIAPEDRWAIVLYVRALQRSQAASVADVPADKRGEIR